MPRAALPWLLLLLVAALLAASLWRPDAVADRLGLGDRGAAARQAHWRDQQRGHYRRVDGNTPAGAVVFLGASSVQGLAVARVNGCAVGLGIGGEETAGLAARLGDYRSLGRAAAIVVMSGANDVLHGHDAGLAGRYRALLAALPQGVPVLMSSPARLPDAGDRDARLRQAAAAARAACAARSGCRFVDLYAAMENPAALVEADGIHLNRDGYALWERLLRAALADAGVADRSCARED